MGLISYSRGDIRIINRVRLEQMTCECYPPVKAESTVSNRGVVYRQATLTCYLLEVTIRKLKSAVPPYALHDDVGSVVPPFEGR